MKKICLGVLAVAVSTSLVSCRSGGTPDDRAQAQAVVAAVADDFKSSGYTADASASVQGVCNRHRSPLSWQEAFTPRMLSLPIPDRSNAAMDTFVGNLGAAYKLAEQARPAGGFATATAKDNHGSTLSLSVPQGTAVRIDGSIAC